MIASAVADFSHNIILREEVCSVRIIISINNVLQMFSQNNSLNWCVLIVCHDIKKTIIKICKSVEPAISNSVNSKSPLFRRNIEFPWIYNYVLINLLSAISNSVI